MKPFLTNGRLFEVAIGLVIAAAAGNLPAQVINVPNSSFESQSGVGQPFNVNVNIDSWQKAGRPAYFPASGFNGFFWVQTAGVFNAPTYGNQVGAQAGFILSFPQAGIFQDFDTRDWDDPVPTHAFNSGFEIGKSYKLTVGLYAKSMIENYSSLELSLYYRDGFNAIVPAGATTVTFSTNIFSNVGPLNLIDFEVNVPIVQFSDAWAGQNIGIKIASVQGDGNGYWDLDNIRLEAIPEPATWSLLAAGVGGLLLARRRSRSRV